MSASPSDRRAAARRSALRALRKAERALERAGKAPSAWEGEFLTSVASRVESFGRAFADPEKGRPGEALSSRQGVKLREILAKARAKDGPAPSGGRLRRRKPLGGPTGMNQSKAR